MKVEPNIPVKMTQAAVKEGIPPMTLEISMAIGVVTDLGTSESNTCWLAPNRVPQIKMAVMPTVVATSTPLTMIKSWLLRFCGCGTTAEPELL